VKASRVDKAGCLTIRDLDDSPQPVARSEPPPALTLAEWLKREISDPDFLLAEIISTSSRIMLVGPTGLGKTMLALAVAFAVARGSGLMHWRAGRKGRVLYVDGEMSRRTLKKRLAEAARRAGVEDVDELALTILSREDFEDMPPLNKPEGKKWMDAFILKYGPFDLLIFDNVQALTEGEHKEEETWRPLLPWVRSLTRRNMGQLWLHHTGHDETKSYGSKAREWQMDAVAMLKRVKNASADLSFEIEFTKARERTPENRRDYETITMSLVDDQWSHGAAPEKSASNRLSPKQQLAYDALTSIAALHGTPLPTAWGLPGGLSSVGVDAFKAELLSRGIVDASAANPRARTAEIITALKVRSRAAERDGRIWPIQKVDTK
jgi:KaiC/GvpD/RAD55 family RecA-like ATPase